MSLTCLLMSVAAIAVSVPCNARELFTVSHQQLDAPSVYHPRCPSAAMSAGRSGCASHYCGRRLPDNDVTRQVYDIARGLWCRLRPDRASRQLHSSPFKTGDASNRVVGCSTCITGLSFRKYCRELVTCSKRDEVNT